MIDPELKEQLDRIENKAEDPNKGLTITMSNGSCLTLLFLLVLLVCTKGCN